MSPDQNSRPFTIAMLALGGQGGGVLTKWLVDIAQDNDFLAQSTYVAGVAQRTGATVYCVDIFPRNKAEEMGQTPVFNLYPIPGAVDLVVASELAEAGRAIQKGFVTPNVTTLVSSSHRVFGITEKTAMGDGIMDQTPLLEKAKKLSKEFICFDMDALALETESVISAVILGAIAGSAALPFPRGSFEEAIRRDGRAVESNLRGFAAGFDGVSSPSPEGGTVPTPLPDVHGPNGEALRNVIQQSLPESCHTVVLHGALRMLDFQDRAYADSYVQKVGDMHAQDTNSEYLLTQRYARILALQMSYEDTIRVADLKTRAERSQRIRQDLNAESEQPAYVVEYFHPRYEEICDTMPAPIGSFLMNSPRLKSLTAPIFKKGRNFQTNKLAGFLTLHFLSKFKRIRRSTFRYRVQQQHITQWDQRIREALDQSYDYALATVDCMEMVSGYGDTYHRGLTRYQTSIDVASRMPPDNRAVTLKRLHSAALADEAGKHFEQAVSEISS